MCRPMHGCAGTPALRFTPLSCTPPHTFPLLQCCALRFVVSPWCASALHVAGPHSSRPCLGKHICTPWHTVASCAQPRLCPTCESLVKPDSFNTSGSVSPLCLPQPAPSSPCRPAVSSCSWGTPASRRHVSASASPSTATTRALPLPSSPRGPPTTRRSFPSPSPAVILPICSPSTGMPRESRKQSNEQSCVK